MIARTGLFQGRNHDLNYLAVGFRCFVPDKTPVQVSQLALLQLLCDSIFAEEKNDIGRATFEFVLDLKGSRIISVPGIQDRDLSSISKADIEPAAKRSSGFQMDKLRLTEECIDNFACRNFT